jgi:sulfite reductase alpha subunit-like flavoprotein
VVREDCEGEGGGWTREEAERYLLGMERERRYLQETW